MKRELGWLLSFSLLAGRLRASTLVVTNTLDSGAGSLRQAILDANATAGDDVIQILAAGIITLVSELPTLTDNTTITAWGTNRVTISGDNHFRVFSMCSGTTNILSGLTITSARGTAAYPDIAYAPGISNAGSLKMLNCVLRDCINQTMDSGYGAALYNSGCVEMEACVISHCLATNGLGWGGGIFNEGTAQITDCTISRCDAARGGGAIFNRGSLTMSSSIVESCSADPASESDGGGILNHGSAVLNTCIVSNCYAFWGGGIESWEAALAITNSILVDNDAPQTGGGLWLSGTGVVYGCTINANSSAFGVGFGAGIYNDFAGSDLRLMNSTVSGNSGGGIMNEGAIYLNHCTIASNTPGDISADVGGIANGGISHSQNSLFAGNGSNDISGRLIFEGYNLVQHTNGCTFEGNMTGNLLGANPLLGPLQENGGPTPTHELLSGSPAIDQGCAGGLLADQRGRPRPFDVLTVENAADGSDIGAYENNLTVVSLGHAYNAGTALGIAVVGNYGYLANGSDGLRIYDISHPDAPFSLGRIYNRGTAFDVVVVGHYAYLANWDDGLRIYDVSNPVKPVKVGHIYDAGHARRIVVSGRYAFLAAC